MIKSGKLRPEEADEDEENEEEDEESEADFEAALATNISGIDNFDTEGGGTDDILAGMKKYHFIIELSADYIQIEACYP